jgi:hypothetical protein
MLLPNLSQKLWTWIFCSPKFCTWGNLLQRLVHFACSFVQEPNNELYLKALEMTEKVLSALTLFMCVCHLVGGWFRVQGLGRRKTKFAYTHWILRLFLEGAALEIQAKIGHSCCCIKEMYVPSALKSLLSHTLKVEFCGIWLEDRPHHCIKSCRSS